MYWEKKIKSNNKNNNCLSFNLHISQLVHPVRWFEIFRKTVIHSCNDFVDGFFPRGFRVLAGNDGLVEFPKCGLDDNSKVIGHLKQKKEHLERDDTATTTVLGRLIGLLKFRSLGFKRNKTSVLMSLHAGRVERQVKTSVIAFWRFWRLMEIMRHAYFISPDRFPQEIDLHW